MQGDNLAILFFAFSTSLVFALEARKEKGRARWTFATIGLLILFVGIFWQQLSSFWPDGKDFERRLVTSPVSWLILIAASGILFAIRKLRDEQFRQNAEVENVLRRFVRPRTLTYLQADAISSHLLQFPPGRSIHIAYDAGDEEASYLAMQLGNALHNGNWQTQTFALRNTEGVFAVSFPWKGIGTWCNGRNDPETMRTGKLIVEALERAGIPPESGGSGTFNSTIEAGLWLVVGTRPIDLEPPQQ